MRPEERALRRFFMRVARVMTGAVLLVLLAGGAVWLRAAIYPWTDRDLPGVRGPHAVLHLVNETGAPIALAWRRAAGPDSVAPAPWIELPPTAEFPEGVVEAEGFRVLAPLPAPGGTPAPAPAPAVPEAGVDGEPRASGTPIELRLVLPGEERVLPLSLSAGDHVQLRLDAARASHMQLGRAGWLGAPDYVDEPATHVAPASAPER